MTIQIAAFAFGGILVFVGVLGGGFEVKELKVPKVGPGVRVLSAVVGLLFICVGFGATTPVDPRGVGSQPEAREQSVDFSLTDQLGDGELSEQVTVLVDGKNVGNLTVNDEYPSSQLRVTVPEAGPHSYTAEATAIFNVEGDRVQYTGAGQGMINVQQGKTYSLRGSMTGNEWLVSLEEEEH
jgi:hypothetical protein